MMPGHTERMRRLSVTRHPGKGPVAPPVLAVALLVILAVGVPLAATVKETDPPAVTV